MHTERTLSGSRVLILGCGDIGSKTAVKLKNFGAETVGIRKKIRPAEGFDCIYDINSLDRELSLADIVIGCLPKTPLTYHLLDSRRISLMKSDGLIVNVGRGSLIDTEALTEALSGGHLYGAILDVFEQEPLPATSPLWTMYNVLITPHISGPSFGHSPHTEKLITDICEENIGRYMNGNPDTTRGAYEKGRFYVDNKEARYQITAVSCFYVSKKCYCQFVLVDYAYRLLISMFSVTNLAILLFYLNTEI